MPNKHAPDQSPHSFWCEDELWQAVLEYVAEHKTEGRASGFMREAAQEKLDRETKENR